MFEWILGCLYWWGLKEKPKEPIQQPPPSTPLCTICDYSDKSDVGKPIYCLAKKERVTRMPINYCEYWGKLVETLMKSKIPCPKCGCRYMRTSGKRFVCGKCGKIFS